MIRTVSPAVASAVAVLVAGTTILGVYDLGPESRHMVAHIVSMNVAAPLLAAFMAVHLASPGIRPAWLWTATLLQIVLLWAWHAPAVYSAVAGAPALQFVLHGLLFAVATLFWLSLLTTDHARRWQAIPALLLTGKLACLLAALLIFAPRALHDSAGHAAHAATQVIALAGLDDQHLAGLLMITACPLSYLIAAVIIASQLVSSKGSQMVAAPRRSIAAGR